MSNKQDTRILGCPKNRILKIKNVLDKGYNSTCTLKSAFYVISTVIYETRSQKRPGVSGHICLVHSWSFCFVDHYLRIAICRSFCNILIPQLVISCCIPSAYCFCGRSAVMFCLHKLSAVYGEVLSREGHLKRWKVHP